MAIRAASIRQATPASGAGVCPHPATRRAAAAQSTLPLPSAGLPLVPGLARPAADLQVVGPDAAQTTAPRVPPVSTCRALRRACCGELPAPCARIGTRLPVLPLVEVCSDRAVRGTFSTGTVGCSIVPVRTVNGPRSRLDRLR